MENMEVLNDEALEGASGGATAINTSNPNGAHWQPTNVAMGTTFVQNGHTWYRIKQGDTLGSIAKSFGTTVDAIARKNPATIKNVNVIFAGDALVIR